ncbi:MAG: LysR family transcriptional regulator, partial [Negativicutes bacterium]|nr:LysR family transcriptional regulator [Negativicutes bacterium]
MGLLQLEYFKALAEREHLTQTAKELMISAPSLSATIARLEREVGFQLFDREGRNIQLNECGRIYLKHVNTIFSALENAKLEMGDAANKHNQHLSIAISSPIIWHDVLQTFIKTHPDIALSHTLLKRDQLESPSYCAQFDFLMTATSDASGSDWEYEILILDDKPVFAVYPSHPFAQHKAVRFIDAKDEPFIAVSKGFSMRKFFDDSCAIAGFSPKIILECDYILRSRMLAAEYGIVFTTESGSRTSALSNAVFVDIIDPALRRTQAIIWNKRRYLSKAAL